MQIKPLHYNVPQIKFQLVQANKNYGVMSRGTGKSSGIGSVYLTECARRMPRSQGGIVGATFQQLLVRTLPPVISNWRRMGYERDVHYVIGREPKPEWRKLWNWKEPYTMPLDSKNAIYWFNGSCQVLISQDRIGSSNGLSLAYIFGDEAKLLNKERLDDEVMPTLRGDRDKFGKLSCYRSEMFLTDMPTGSKGLWILDKLEDMDERTISLILDIQLHLNSLMVKAIKAKGVTRKNLNRKIAKFERMLNDLRKKSVYYAEANALENLDVLGQEYIDDMKRQLSKPKFLSSIMNKRNVKIEDGFYGNLDEDIHGADWFDYDHLDSIIQTDFTEYEQTSIQDAGYLRHEPLDLAFDYGTFNCCMVGQEVGNEYRLLHGFHEFRPKLVQDVAKKFCNYFKDYPTKVVNYYFDHTAMGGMANTSYTYKESVVHVLKSNGWHVNEVYCGLAPRHDRKYEVLNTILSEKDPLLPKLRYSKSHCESWQISCNSAPTKQGKSGFEKDKSSEKDPDIPANLATHYSDAGDTLLFFKLHKRLSGGTLFVPASSK